MVYYTTKNVVSGSRLTEGGQSDVVSFVVWVLIRFCISFAPQRLGRNLGLVPLHWRLASSSTPDFGLMGTMERHHHHPTNQPKCAQVASQVACDPTAAQRAEGLQILS